MDEEIGLRLSLKNRRETVAGLDDVADKENRVGDEAERIGHKSRIGAAGLISMGKAGRISGRAIVYGVGAAATAVVGAGIVLSKLAHDSIEEAREAQKVGAVTRQEIKATGGAANVSAKQVERLAGAISKKVGIDDEEIQSGANLVLMNKNVQNQMGKGNKIFDRAVRDATDMSAVTGNLTTNSKLLAKVLGDPLKAITGLSKAQVKFTDQQAKQIQQDVKNNDILGAQKIVLGAVEDRVHGVAAAQATWGEKASVAIGNIKEGIGTALLPALDATEKWFVQKGTPVLEDYVGIFEKRGIPAIQKYAGIFRDEGIPAIRGFLDEAKPLAKSILPAIGTGLTTTADAFKVIAPRAKAVFDGFNNLPDWAKSAIAITAGAGVVGKKLGVGSLILGGRGTVGGAGGALGAISRNKPLPVYVVNSAGVPGTPGTRTTSGQPVVTTTADDRRQPMSRAKKVGNTSAGIIGTILGPWIADQMVAEAKWPWTEGPFAPRVIDKNWKETWARIEANTKDGAAGLSKLLDPPRSRLMSTKEAADALGSSLGAVGRSRTEPRFGIPTLPKAQSGVDYFLGTLNRVDRTVARPAIYIDGINDAESRLDSVLSKATQLNYMGIGPAAPSAPKPTHRAGGGPVKAGRPYVVGERRAELFVPKADGTIIPKVPTQSAAPQQPIVIQLLLPDGQILTELVVDQLRQNQSHRHAMTNTIVTELQDRSARA